MTRRKVTMTMSRENEDATPPFKPLTSIERVITTSSLNGFTKYIGSFLNFMEQLPIMAPMALAGLFQLFNFYVLAVVNIFVPQPRLRSLLGEHDANDTSGPAWTYINLRNALLRTKHVHDSNLNISVILEDELSSPELLFGMAKICNATESVRFLLEMCQALRSDIMRSQPPGNRVGAKALYSSAEAVTFELRAFMYAGAAERLLPIPEVTDQMKGLKWDPRDLPETFNPYVSQLLTRMSGRLALIRKPDSKVPKHLHTLLWRKLVTQTMCALLESFSQIKRCTNNGRAQMSLICQPYNGIDKEVSGSANCSAAEIANGYIKAYYYDTADDLCAWIQGGKDFQGLALRHAVVS